MYASTKYKSIAPYLRDCALHKEIKIIRGIEGVEYELRRIGNNLNQLCIIANKTGNIDYHRIRYALDDLNKKIVQIRTDVLLPRKAVDDGNN